MAENNDLKKLTSLTPILKGDINSFIGTLSNNFIINTSKDFLFGKSIVNIITSDLIEYKYCINIKFYLNDLIAKDKENKDKDNMSEIKELKELVVGLINKVDDGFEKINNRVDKLEQKVDTISNDVSIIKNNVIRLNSEVFNKNELF